MSYRIARAIEKAGLRKDAIAEYKVCLRNNPKDYRVWRKLNRLINRCSKDILEKHIKYVKRDEPNPDTWLILDMPEFIPCDNEYDCLYLYIIYRKHKNLDECIKILQNVYVQYEYDNRRIENLLEKLANIYIYQLNDHEKCMEVISKMPNPRNILNRLYSNDKLTLNQILKYAKPEYFGRYEPSRNNIGRIFSLKNINIRSRDYSIFIDYILADYDNRKCIIDQLEYTSRLTKLLFDRLAYRNSIKELGMDKIVEAIIADYL
jgi:hypothetical protein